MRNIKRERWLDAAKGFGMVLVVAGHAYHQSDLITYIYWFHMPAFFIFSGYVSKSIDNWTQIGANLKKRAHTLFIPYLKYLGLFTAIRYLAEFTQGNFTWDWYLKDFENVLFGGRFITSYYGVFCFITCLFFTQTLFLIIFYAFKTTKTRLVFILFLYIISHIEGGYVGTLSGPEPSLYVLIPWNMDVSMLAIFYYSIGYYAKIILKRIPLLLTGCCVLLTGGFIALQEFHLLDYHLSMKYISYNHFVLDLIIPLLMTTAYCGIFQLIKSEKALMFFSFINSKSTAIMYMHIGVNKILLHFMGYGNVIYTIVGVAVPLLVIVLMKAGRDRVSLQGHNEFQYSKEAETR